MCLGSAIKLSSHLTALRRQFMRSGSASDTSLRNPTSNLRISWQRRNVRDLTFNQCKKMLQIHYRWLLLCSLPATMLLTWLCNRTVCREGIPGLQSVMRALPAANEPQLWAWKEPCVHLLGWLFLPSNEFSITQMYKLFMWLFRGTNWGEWKRLAESALFMPPFGRACSSVMLIQRQMR